MAAKHSPEFPIWVANRQATREAHQKFNQQQPVEEWLAAIEIDAAKWIGEFGSATKRGVNADIRRAAFKYLEECAISLAEPPPPSLVKLIGLLMGLKPAQRRVKSKEKFLLVAKFVVDNPKAAPSRIRRETGTDLRQLKAWMASTEFRKTVDRFKLFRTKKSGG